MNSIEKYEAIPSEKNNFPVRLLCMTLASGKSVVEHWHEHTEMLFFLSGRGVVRCGAETADVRENTLIIVNGNELHTIYAEERLDYRVIILSPEFFRDMDSGQPIFEHCIQDDAVVDDFLREIFDEHEKQRPGCDMIIKGDMYKLAAHLWRSRRAQTLPNRDYDARQLRLRRVNDAVKYINENYDSDLSLRFFTERYFLSRSYFCHMFKECAGLPLTEYINAVRIRKSALLLNQTDLTVTEISARTGFNDVNYFCRVFKKNMGCSPTEYKNSAEAMNQTGQK